MLRIFCKAYTVADLCAYAGFQTLSRLGNDEFCYLWNDFTVSNSPVPDAIDSIVFDAVTPEWKVFCMQKLNFSIPSDVSALVAS
ncbi:MAG: hypothetical protein OHK0022_45580 [Roseiflexaceae bacterium]